MELFFILKYLFGFAERCLLYTMRLWGNSISTLRIASGTIFNEVGWLFLFVFFTLNLLPAGSLSSLAALSRFGFCF